jgi:hypothetical protein
MIIDPSLPLEEAAESRLSLIHERSDYSKEWQHLTSLEQQILLCIQRGESSLYKQEIRRQIANNLGLSLAISTSTVQTNIKKLMNKELVTKQMDGQLALNSGLFNQWIVDHVLKKGKEE